MVILIHINKHSKQYLELKVSLGNQYSTIITIDKVQILEGEKSNQKSF
jgi:hypothetical protein